jgi:hypothetical protein
MQSASKKSNWDQSLGWLCPGSPANSMFGLYPRLNMQASVIQSGTSDRCVSNAASAMQQQYIYIKPKNIIRVKDLLAECP